jgi:hypothetical protein
VGERRGKTPGRVVYAASEERDVLSRHLRAFGVELLLAVERTGLSAKEAAAARRTREDGRAVASSRHR